MASTASPSTSLARCRGWAGSANLRQRSSTCFSNARVLRASASTGVACSSAVAMALAAVLRRAASGSERRFSASGRVSASLPTLISIRLRVSSDRRDQLPTAGERSTSMRSRSGVSSCGRVRRTRRSHGRQRAAGGVAPSGPRLDLVLVERIEFQREEQALGPDGRGPDPNVGLELGPGGIVPGGGGGQAGISPNAPELVGGVLVEADALVDQGAQLGRLCPGGDEACPSAPPARCWRPAGGRFQILVDPRIVAADIEVVEPPLRQGFQFHGRVHEGRFTGWLSAAPPQLTSVRFRPQA